MTPRHPARAALGAAIVALAVVAIFGNQWFDEHVIEKADGQLARQLLHVVATFPWRVDTRGSTTIWVGQIVGAVLAVLLTFLLVWAVAKRASGLALLVGAWGATVLAAMLAGFVEVLVLYGEFFPSGVRDPEGFGRFWYAVFQGAQPAALFGLAVGVVGGLFAMLLAGAVSQPVAPVIWQPGPAGGGYGGVSLSPVPAGYGTDAGVDPTTPYINPYPSAPAPASTAGPYPSVSPAAAVVDPNAGYPYTSEVEAAPPPPPPGSDQFGSDRSDPTTVIPGAVDPASGAPHDEADPTTVMPSQREWAPPPPSAASPSWSRPEDPTRHD